MFYESLLEKHIDELGRILIAFSMDSPAVIRMLEDEKRALSLKYEYDGDEFARSIYEPACYNALASIRTAIEQERPNPQLVACVKDARDELKEILLYLKESKNEN